MKKKMIFIAFAGCLVQQALAQVPDEKINAVENNLHGWVQIADSAGWNIYDRMRHYHINGLSIAVIDNYKIVWAKGYGWADTAEKKAVTATTLFQPASAGKSIHAVGTMRLVEKGKLDPLKDINIYLRWWKFPYDSVSKGKKINTLQLLSHTAGISIHGFDGYKPNAVLPTIEQILAGTPPANSGAIKSELEPGLRFQYSGGGYTISGLMIEDISGKKYADYMRQTVLKPLGMTRTFFYGELSEKDKKNTATGYRFDGKPIGARYHVYPEDACGASLWSTPTDIARFLVELQLSLKGKSNKVLTRKTVNEMLTPYGSDFYGLGFFIENRDGQKWFHHTGLNEGFVSDYYASMEGGKGVVIMANTDLAADIDITEEITNSVAAVYDWKGFYKPSLKKEIALADTAISQYIGTYKFEGMDHTVRITHQKGRLWFWNANAVDPWEVHLTKDETFFFREVPFIEHQFNRTAAGVVSGFTIKTVNGNIRVLKEN